MPDFSAPEAVDKPGARRAMEIAHQKIATPKAEKYIISTGWFQREGQRIYYLEWGKRGGVPFVDLHGGPGASFEKSHVALFNGDKDHVIFFDQRGCGESTPSANGLTPEQIAQTNTPAHTVEDIEALCDKIFGPDVQVHVAGGSYGSTLALTHAIMHPERVKSLELWSGFLGEKDEIEEMFSDREGLPSFMARAWKRFIALVPSEDQSSPRKVIEYYAQMISSPDKEVAHKFALEFELYEDTLCSPDDFDSAKLEEELKADPNLVNWARIEILYHLNGEYLEEDGYILNNIDKIQNIPCRIVQGERDWCTPEKHARRLQEKYGKNCTVEVVKSGHMRSDKAMREALQKNMTSHAE